ncbi:MAG: 3-phosphoshikimate 1-carboxyvinyltransferase [archaeon]|nr:3-phosphoshikimate 1-carboxyvinyltransferase [archaeon]
MIEIKPVKELFDATVKAPPSKSYTNRALLIAALCGGKARIMNALESDDTEHMAGALRQLGVSVEKQGDIYIVCGRRGRLDAPQDPIFLGNAGTAMRFLTTACALVESGHVILKGNERMNERPIGDLLDALGLLGVSAHSIKSDGCPPVLVEGGGIEGGTTKIKGDKSSQYFTSILLCAPYARKDVVVDTVGELTSKSYIDMTISSMREFGINVENDGYRSFKVKAGQVYYARDYVVEGDFSSASYLFAAAAVTGSRVRVTGINPASAQGDKGFVGALVKMGCSRDEGPDWIEIKGPRKLKGVGEIDMNHMPDAAMTLAVVAAFGEGVTRIVNAANMRIKETDRIAATVAELKKMGVDASELSDGLVVKGGDVHGAVIDTYDDHRIAMSFAVAGLRVAGVVIKDESCVSKTYPDFFGVLEDIKKQI